MRPVILIRHFWQRHAGWRRRSCSPPPPPTASIAAAFYSFLPTAYPGLSELGLIAGVGIIIALATTLTLLPALLTVLKPPPEQKPIGFAALASLDRFLEKRRNWIV